MIEARDARATIVDRARCAAALRDDGFCATERVFTPRELEVARNATDQLLAAYGASSEYGRISLDAWRRAPALRELLPTVARRARELLGFSEVLVFQDLVIDKPPTATAPLPYHQDQSYLPLDRDDGLVAWVALDDADARRGCLHYVAGTHRLGARRPARFSGAAQRDAHLPPIEVDGRAMVAVAARAGQALFHSPLVWHGSPPNSTSLPRRAWSIYFLHPDVRWAPDRAAHPYLLELAPMAGARVAGERFPKF
jgi:ectoine hydroxylase-related dioxygenase (phytanoyl-CoA dioxygenase family)